MTTGRVYRAECQDCPTTKGDYGERVHNGLERVHPAAVHLWAMRHEKETGHNVTVSDFIRMSIRVDYLNEDLLRKLFGNATDQPTA